MPALPFVYSNEVWTGIEYQAASHMILMGLPGEGLDIVRACRARYDGKARNPFDEYEWGHWYARAMASYALLEALGGARHDAVEGVLHLRPALRGLPVLPLDGCGLRDRRRHGRKALRAGRFREVRVQGDPLRPRPGRGVVAIVSDLSE